jgi:hypothetical protein
MSRGSFEGGGRDGEREVWLMWIGDGCGLRRADC